MKISALIIDDNPDDRTLVIRELRKGMEIQPREIFDEAGLLKALEQGGFDLVITDYQLQWTDGLKVLELVKAKYPECPVIMFTGTGTQETAVEAMKKGLDDYLIKAPRHYIRIVPAVQSVLKMRNEHREKIAAEQALEAMHEEIVSLFGMIPTGVVLAEIGGSVRYANLIAADALKVKAGDDLRNHFEVDLFAGETLENELLYSPAARRSFLTTRKKYKEMHLFLFEPLEDELKKSGKLSSSLAVHSFDDITGLDRLKETARTLAVQNVNILILGESGTGKELVASAIHNASPRAHARFVAVNCGAIPDTLFESELFGYKRGAFTDARFDRAGKIEYASGGTLFLDEIGDLPLHVQSKMLRVIEDKTISPLGGNEARKIDVRFVFATNCNLEQMVRDKKFREDLYYRINSPAIRIPPLRERKEEIRPLVDHFLAQLQDRHSRFISGITEDSMKRLMAYDFPGNVRELEGILRNAFYTSRGEKIELAELPSGPVSEVPVEERVKQYRARLVYESYLALGQDIDRTSKALGLSQRQIYRYIKEAKKA
jgi:DNA-binding NtrC family response regulator